MSDQSNEQGEAWPYWEVSLTTREEGVNGADLLVWGWGDWADAHDFTLAVMGKTGDVAQGIAQQRGLCDAGCGFDPDCVIDRAVIRKMLSAPTPLAHPILREFNVRWKETE